MEKPSYMVGWLIWICCSRALERRCLVSVLTCLLPLFPEGRPTRPSSTKGTCYANACRLSLCCAKLNFCHLRIGRNQEQKRSFCTKGEITYMAGNFFWNNESTRKYENMKVHDMAAQAKPLTLLGPLLPWKNNFFGLNYQVPTITLQDHHGVPPLLCAQSIVLIYRSVKSGEFRLWSPSSFLMGTLSEKGKGRKRTLVNINVFCNFPPCEWSNVGEKKRLPCSKAALPLYLDTVFIFLLRDCDRNRASHATWRFGDCDFC